MNRLWAIVRKEDGAFFPIQAGSHANSWIEFPDIGMPAELPPRTFTTIGAAKGCLTTWLKGPLVKTYAGSSGYDSFNMEYYDEPSKFEHKHDPKRGTRDDYDVIEVCLTPVTPKP